MNQSNLGPSNLGPLLAKSGLNDKEALIYAALVDLGGGGYPSAIASKAGIVRSTAYKVLTGLSIKGLINEIEKWNKIYYQLEKPERLIRYAKKQIEFAEGQLEQAEKLFPELQGIFALTEGKPKVLFFEGPEAIELIYKDTIQEQEPYEMLAVGNAKEFKRHLSAKEIRHFVTEKQRLGITTRGILPDTDEDKAYSQAVFNGIEKKYWPVMRHIPESLFPFQSEITIYGDRKVAITKFGSKNVIGVIIEDIVIHGMMKMVFELAWKGADPASYK